MRNNPTEPEKRLWRHLSNSQLGGFKFRRQSVVGARIVDFFCPSIGLIVEVDGDTHDADIDGARDEAALAIGFATIRVTNADVMANMDGVLEAILKMSMTLDQRTAWRRPHPNPSPEGEGLSK